MIALYVAGTAAVYVYALYIRNHDNVARFMELEEDVTNV